MTDAELHLNRVGALWPDIGAHALRPIGDGWTCATYEVDGRWIVQFPRTEYAKETLRKQCSLLPRLSGRLPVAIPIPVPSVNPAVSAMLYRKIEGKPFPDSPAGAWPEQLGALVRDLQGIEPHELGIADRTGDDVRREQSAELEKMSEHVVPLLGTKERKELQRIFSKYLRGEQAWSFRPAIVHNDLGPPHILVGESGDLAGVIDWEELSAGDPVVDFAWMLGEHPKTGRRMLDSFGGETDEGFHFRAKVLYLLMPFYEVIYGQENGQPEFIESGLNGLVSRLRRFYE